NKKLEAPKENVTLHVTQGNATEEELDIDKEKISKHSVLFNEWWNLYDLKRDKKKCESKYKTLLKKYSHEEMMEGTKNYINHLKHLKQRGEFVPQKRLPSTFLNNENFNDEYEQPKKAVNAEW